MLLPPRYLEIVSRDKIITSSARFGIVAVTLHQFGACCINLLHFAPRKASRTETITLRESQGKRERGGVVPLLIASTGGGRDHGRQGEGAKPYTEGKYFISSPNRAFEGT